MHLNNVNVYIYVSWEVRCSMRWRNVCRGGFERERKSEDNMESVVERDTRERGLRREDAQECEE